MTIKEVVLAVEDRPGELARVFGHLYENDINVLGFWLGTEDTGTVLRFVVSDPEGAASVLTGLDFKVTISDVIAAQIPDHPGGLNMLLKALQSAQINIVHIYPCLEVWRAVLILEVDRLDEAVGVLKDNWIHLYDEGTFKGA